MLHKLKQFYALLAIILGSNLKAIEPALDNLHILTFVPQHNGQKLDTNTNSLFEPIAQALKDGKRTELNGTVIQISHKNIALYSSLPENHTGTIYLNVPPLICSIDKRNYPERGAYEVYSLFKSGVIDKGVGVSYCPPNHKLNSFNFGQEDDQKMIATLINQITKKNPQAKIVLMGICAGATGIINTLAGSELSPEAKRNIDAAVLQSPAISSDKVWQDMGNSYLPTGFKWLLPIVAPLYFGKCKACKPKEEVLGSYKNIPTHIGFMIGKLAKDSVTPTESVKEIETTLKANNHSVTVFESKDTKIKHGFLAPNKEYQAHIKQFLTQRKLDHVTPECISVDDHSLRLDWFL